MLMTLARMLVPAIDSFITVINRIIDLLLAPIYLCRGMRPFSLGYTSYKRIAIGWALRSNPFARDDWPRRFGFRLDERIVEYPWFFSRLPPGSGVLLDAGSVLNFDYILQHPRLASKRVFIATLAPELRSYTRRGISYIYEDLRDSCFRDEYFDWIVSLSTIEHIGLDNTLLYTADTSKNELRDRDYLKALAEYRRILRAGGTLFLSFPYGKRAVCEWYQVFDEAAVEEMIAFFEPCEHQRAYFRYYADGWRPATAAECADANTFDIHSSKQYEPDFLAFSRAICCVELRK
ncbi:MAG: hypothetical protein OHK0015_11720 [Chloroflexi bacterium OHK40]